MSDRNPDLLPQSPAVSALVRRIAFKLDASLVFNGHRRLSLEERAGFFDLGDASSMLDRLATLRGMAEPEARARRDLLELFDVFNPPPSGAHTEPQETCQACAAPPVPTYGQKIQILEDAADARGCLP